MEYQPRTDGATGGKKPVTKFGREKPSHEAVLVAIYQDADYWLRKAHFFLGESFEPEQVEDVLFNFLESELNTVVANYNPDDDSKATFSTYFTRALRYHCLKHSTAHENRLANFRRVDRLEQNLLDPPIGVTLVDPGLNIDERLLREAQLDECNKVLKEMPKAYRAAVILVDGGEMSYAAAANRLGATATQVRSWVHRGRARSIQLRTWLETNPLTALSARNWPAIARALLGANSEPGLSVAKRIWDLGSEQFRSHAHQLARMDSAVHSIPPAAFIAELNEILALPSFHVDLTASSQKRPEFVRISKMPSRGAIANTRLNRILFDDFFRIFLRH